jgi:hypothetical protein
MVIIVIIILIFLMLLINDNSDNSDNTVITGSTTTVITGGSYSPELIEYLGNLHVIGDCSTFTGGGTLFGGSIGGQLVDDSEILTSSKVENTDVELFVNLYSNAVNEKLWNEYDTWEEVEANPSALKKYVELKKAALAYPDFDWTKVVAESDKMRKSNYEYIGHIDVEKDGRTLYISNSEKSEDEGKVKKNSNVYASISLEVLNRNITKPAMFLFHNHPDSHLCDQLPSTNDLLVAIYLAATNRFVANVLISRYGVIVYTVDNAKIKQIHTGNFDLNLANYSYDILSVNESSRSFTNYTIQDRLNFYKTYGLMLAVYPSSEFVALMRKNPIYSNMLDRDIDHELIANYAKEIEKIKKNNRRKH